MLQHLTLHAMLKLTELQLDRVTESQTQGAILTQ